jgi:hypothetical protein
MAGTFRTTGTTSAASVIIRSGDGTTSAQFAYVRFVNDNTTGQDWRIGNYGTNNLSFVNATSSTIPLVLDSSGNLGLGVTPSAWNQGRAIEVYQQGYGIWNGTSSIYSLANTYFDGGFKYANNAQASHYYQFQGAHVWSTAPSGTAGNAITFTQAMTLDASGNLLVGATAATYNASGRGLIEINGSSSTLLGFKTAGSNRGYVYSDGTDMSVFNAMSGYLAFGTNNTERARIDASGNLLVGTTTASSSITNGFTVTGPAAVTALGIGHVTGSGSGTNFVVFNYDGSAIGSITQSGTTAVLYNTTSDQRLKENIQDAAPASALIDAIQVRQFDWKSDGSHQRYGFVAQELVTVAPEAVHAPADPEEMMAVDYSKLVPLLVKEIQDLRKRLAAAGI